MIKVTRSEDGSRWPRRLEEQLEESLDGLDADEAAEQVAEALREVYGGKWIIRHSPETGEFVVERSQ